MSRLKAKLCWWSLIVLISVMLQALAVAWVLAAEEFVVGIAEWYIPEGIAFWERVLVPEFNKIYPNLKVVIRNTGWSADKIMVQYAGGAAPDVIQFGTNKLGSFKPMLEPLDGFMAKSNIDQLEDFPPGALKAGYTRGKLYGIPFSLDVRTMVYRKDLFERAGLDSSRGPDTWDEIITYGRKLTTRTSSGEIDVEGINVSTHWFDFSPWMFQAGGQYITEDEMHCSFASSEVETAVKFAQDLVFVHKVAMKDSPGPKAGRSAMAYASAGVLEADDPDIGVSLPPKGVKRTTLVTADSWGIINTSKHKEAAWTWIRLASKKEYLAEMARLNMLIPPRLSFASLPPWNRDRRLRLFFESAAIGTTFIGTGVPRFEFIVQKIISPTLYKIIYEGAPVRNELGKASKEIEQMLIEDMKKK